MTIESKKKDIRTITLKNSAMVVAHMQIQWELGDNMGTYEEGGYHDVLIGQDKSIDLANTHIPENATVNLKVEVVAARDKTAHETFVYKKESKACAVYELTGTTLQKELNLLSYTVNG